MKRECIPKIIKVSCGLITRCNRRKYNNKMKRMLIKYRGKKTFGSKVEEINSYLFFANGNKLQFYVNKFNFTY